MKIKSFFASLMAGAMMIGTALSFTACDEVEEALTAFIDEAVGTYDMKGHFYIYYNNEVLFDIPEEEGGTVVVNREGNDLKVTDPNDNSSDQTAVTLTDCTQRTAGGFFFNVNAMETDGMHFIKYTTVEATLTDGTKKLYSGSYENGKLTFSMQIDPADLQTLLTEKVYGNLEDQAEALADDPEEYTYTKEMMSNMQAVVVFNAVKK